MTSLSERPITFLGVPWRQLHEPPREPASIHHTIPNSHGRDTKGLNRNLAAKRSTTSAAHRSGGYCRADGFAANTRTVAMPDYILTSVDAYAGHRAVNSVSDHHTLSLVYDGGSAEESIDVLPSYRRLALRLPESTEIGFPSKRASLSVQPSVARNSLRKTKAATRYDVVAEILAPTTPQCGSRATLSRTSTTAASPNTNTPSRVDRQPQDGAK